MAKTPDRSPGPLVEEEVQFEDRTDDGDPTLAGAVRRIGDFLRFKANFLVQQLLQVKNYPAGFGDIDLDGVNDGDILAYDSTENSIIPVAPGSGGAHIIQDEGTSLPQRVNLNFSGDGVAATDDSGNNATKVTISSGLPSANDFGQVLFSVDGATFEVRQPITTEAGWLVNDEGHLLVTGC